MSPPLIQSDKWTWQTAAIDPPLTVLAGDVISEFGGQLLVTRGGVVVETRTIGPVTTVAAVVTEPSTIRSAVFLKVKPMPGQNVSCTQVRENASTGAVTFDFSSGSNREIADWAGVEFIANSLDSNPTLAEDILIGKAFRASPDGANKTTQVGAQVSVNLTADNPVIYTEPL